MGLGSTLVKQAVRPPQDRTAISDWLVFFAAVSLMTSICATSLAVAAFMSSVAVLLGGWIMCGACIFGGSLLIGLSFTAGALCAGATVGSILLKSTSSILSRIAPSLHAWVLQKYLSTLVLAGLSPGGPPASASLASANHEAKPSVRKPQHHSPNRAKDARPHGNHGPWADGVAQPLFEEEDSTLPLHAHFLARKLPEHYSTAGAVGEHTSTAGTAGEHTISGFVSHTHQGPAQPPSPDYHAKPCSSAQDRDVQRQPKTASLTADQLAALPTGTKPGQPPGDAGSDVTTTSQASSKSRKAARYRANKQKQKQQAEIPDEAEQHV